MKNTQELIDSLIPHKLGGNELDEVNNSLLVAANEMKEEVLPNINECRKCGVELKEGSLCGWCAV